MSIEHVFYVDIQYFKLHATSIPGVKSLCIHINLSISLTCKMILLDLDTHVTLKLQSTFIYIAQRQHEQVSITHIKQGIAQTTMSKER